MVSEVSQIPIKFEPNTLYGRDDFMVNSCNIDAVKMIESWPDWPFFAFSLFGPKGCGKSHLAHIFAETVAFKTKKPALVGFVKAEALNLKKVKKLHDEYLCLVVENLDDKLSEESLFHLFNLYQNEGGYLFLTSSKPLSHIHFDLLDLSSRLKMVPSIAVLEPDDQMLSALVVKLFSDRQILISEETLSYILHHMERSFSYAIRLVDEADAISLSLKRAVSISIVKQAMNHLSKKTQPDLF